jgi:hypothetical protein
MIASSAFRSSGDFVTEDKKVYGDSVGQSDGKCHRRAYKLKKLLDDEVISKDEFNIMKR